MGLGLIQRVLSFECSLFSDGKTSLVYGTIVRPLSSYGQDYTVVYVRPSL